MATDESTVIAGTGNVFADLNMPDADDRLLKAQLAALIGETIAQLGLTQTAAAKLLGIAQPDVSSLLRGRLRGYSLERLIDFARTSATTLKSRCCGRSAKHVAISPCWSPEQLPKRLGSLVKPKTKTAPSRSIASRGGSGGASFGSRCEQVGALRRDPFLRRFEDQPQ